MKYFSISLVIILLSCLSSVHSETKVYKYIDENGKTVYTSRPPDNLQNVQEVDLQDANVIPAYKSKAKQDEVKRQHDTVSGRIKEKISARQKRDAEIKTTKKDIANKKEALEKGIEPLPGERIGTSGILSSGSTRFTEGYHDRVKKLEHELKVSEEKLRELLNQK